MKHVIKPLFCFFLLVLSQTIAAKPRSLSEQALETMKKATVFMMDSVSYNGGFVWAYLPDFSRQWGEMEANRTMVWTQAPGTPEMGQILLDAYHATKDEYYYEQAKKVAQALIWGQHESGGWNYVFDFAGEASLKDWYATVGHSGWRLEEFQHYYGNATFDDACTIQCAKFLLRIYVEKNDPAFRTALEKSIAFVLDSQYPNGGWPQRYPLMYDHPINGQADYTSFVTLNDDVIPKCIEFLIQCYQTLGMSKVKEPILRAMYLTIVLQQGKPYAGWSPQYTVGDLKPAHARSYEPCSVSTSTTVSMIYQLMDYYRLTGDTRFLSGVPDAIEFLESQRLPTSEEAKWTRQSSDPDAFLVPNFLDPTTGKPLYVHRMGSNVFNGHYYIDQELSHTIGHYGSAVRVNTKNIRTQFEKLRQMPVKEVIKDSPLTQDTLIPLPKFYSTNTRQEVNKSAIRTIIESLSDRGCWLSPLRNTSNPYKAGASTVPSKETEYASTNVGDIYDTSPYRNTTQEVCISTQDYIMKMASLIRFIDQAGQ